jgi:hypothetical protein
MTLYALPEIEMMSSAPKWVPKEAVRYLTHTELGLSIRALARQAGCHASTVLRQVRRCENRRDDLLVDGALKTLGRTHFQPALAQQHTIIQRKDKTHMTVLPRPLPTPVDDTTIEREGRRILRRLCETGAVLAVAVDMEKAVVVRTNPSGTNTKTAVVDRAVAEAMALKDWISCEKRARIARYRITSTGRAALKRLLAETKGSENDQGFAEQHRDWGVKSVLQSESGTVRKHRYNLAESPLAGLARRKDKDGKPFLSETLVAAGERLREDFELAQMGPRVTQNWDRFLTAGTDGGSLSADQRATGPEGARARVSAALRDLGPGLGDVVLRCCCFLEGMEVAEKRMGWSARSGKIVLRIALQRLKRHYEETTGPHGPLVG